MTYNLQSMPYISNLFSYDSKETQLQNTIFIPVLFTQRSEIKAYCKSTSVLNHYEKVNVVTNTKQLMVRQRNNSSMGFEVMLPSACSFILDVSLSYI
jgi:cell fate (sporulation/competence/biofilm development) regulator YmcA (YheA/YmcA/DUF963 family)